MLSDAALLLSASSLVFFSLAAFFSLALRLDSALADEAILSERFLASSAFFLELKLACASELSASVLVVGAKAPHKIKANTATMMLALAWRFFWLEFPKINTTDESA